jgi:hypothetical protein
MLQINITPIGYPYELSTTLALAERFVNSLAA